jgi:hypothetical protein
MSTVTPIRPQASGLKKSRPRRGKFMLEDPREGPGTLRLLQALRGVCQATELLAPEHRDDNFDLALQLGTAAEILSGMLEDRITVL